MRMPAEKQNGAGFFYRVASQIKVADVRRPRRRADW